MRPYESTSYDAALEPQSQPDQPSPEPTVGYSCGGDPATVPEISTVSPYPAAIASPQQTAGDAARDYIALGWAPIPVPISQKNPGFANWPKLRITAETVDSHFPGGPSNIGVLLGEPSGGLVDIDLDDPIAVKLAPLYLPHTPARFGRAGKPQSHFLFIVRNPFVSQVFRRADGQVVLEIRSTGLQTIFPPGFHPSGEAIVWQGEGLQPMIVDAAHLLECIRRLHEAVLNHHGERASAKTATAAGVVDLTFSASIEERVTACRAAILRITVQDSNDGSKRLLSYACRCVEHDLDPATSVQLIRECEVERPFPRSWSDTEIRQRLADAENHCSRGSALSRTPDGATSLGTRDPRSGKLILSTAQTMPTADAFVQQKFTHPDGRTLHHHGGEFLAWDGSRYRAVEDGALRGELLPWLDGSLRLVNGRDGEVELQPFPANPTTVNAALGSISARVHLPAEIEEPVWLDHRPDRPDPMEILPLKSSLLHLPSGRLYAPTPSWFCRSALDYDWNPNAPDPVEWLRFLHQVTGGDLEQIRLLKQWFGYLLTRSTRQQKILLIVGPPRAGKGVIRDVLTSLVGRQNVAGPTTAGLAGEFGLEPLVGKTLAVISDARFSGRNVQDAIERLLCITGEDPLTVNRKNRTMPTKKLGCRLMILSNELPRLPDASTAIATRFMVVRLSESFLGREDVGLKDRLVAEREGILNWAIQGYHDLAANGRFIEPASTSGLLQEIVDLSSPVGAFVRDECILGSGLSVTVEEINRRWELYRTRAALDGPTKPAAFGKRLKAVALGIKLVRTPPGKPSLYTGITLR